eukprot:5779979-Pleurochrysis_carterae.AAC.1
MPFALQALPCLDQTPAIARRCFAEEGSAPNDYRGAHSHVGKHAMQGRLCKKLGALFGQRTYPMRLLPTACSELLSSLARLWVGWGVTSRVCATGGGGGWRTPGGGDAEPTARHVPLDAWEAMWREVAETDVPGPVSAS